MPNLPEIFPARGLEEVLATDELARRPSRPPDHAAENRALVALAAVLAENPAYVLQPLAEFARQLCGADSAAVSLAASENASAPARWQAAAGAWAGSFHDSQPFAESPGGLALERDGWLLLKKPERHFEALRALQPPAVEALLVPFHLGDRLAGTIWVATHTGHRRFDLEDARALRTIAPFASAACATMERLGSVQGMRRERVAALNLMEEAIAARAELDRTAAALRASEQQFRRAIEEAPIPVIMHAEDGQVLQISRTWTELTGYTQEDLPTFDGWLNRAYGEGADSVRGRLRAVFAGEAARHRFELQITTRAGERRDWVLTTSAPGRLRDGRRFAVGMVIDMTERMRAERDLRGSEERLQEADRRKTHFLALLGHELRNPLAAIRGGITLLRSEKTQPATRARTLPIVADQVAHLERLVDDLLDVTRIVSGRVQLRRARITVQEVLADAVEMLRLPIEAGAFDLQQHVEPEPLVVDGDAVRLSQVVVNVLSNALKYSGGARRIDLSAWAAAWEACISIRDYGPGIAPELLPSIFEPFVQAKAALTLEGGVGLGLAVVRQLVEQHGGWVEALSGGERQGSEFLIRLPLAGPG